MGVPLLDLQAHHAPLRQLLDGAIRGVLDSNRYILGPEVERLERSLADYCGCAFAVGVSSGTDALLAALMALDVGPGDEVVTSPFTFFATAGCVSRLGARTVFVDIEPNSFNMDTMQLERALTPRTKAIMPVHLFGQCVEMEPLLGLARARDVPVVEDAAQAIGAEYRGRRAGSLGTLGCFSFFPSKNLGCMGDGGLVTTQGEEIHRKLVKLRGHGASPKYHHSLIGGNFRLDAMQAALLSVKLPHLEDWHARRGLNAGAYLERLGDLERDGKVKLPRMAPDRRHVWNQFTLRVLDGRRDALVRALGARGIGCEVYYPVPLHLQECFVGLGYGPGDFPEAERAAREVVSIPIYPELRPEQIDEVCSGLRAALA